MPDGLFQHVLDIPVLKRSKTTRECFTVFNKAQLPFCKEAIPGLRMFIVIGAKTTSNVLAQGVDRKIQRTVSDVTKLRTPMVKALNACS